jgi:hypothetical protein|tara:strand:- start:46 stop:1335 length:1290 start_codon:yes stop_codon:yes gene_type:complete
MFRYGGPIKEGIMQGMQDRPGYFLGGIIPLAGAALRALPVIGRGILTKGTPRAPGAKSFFRNIFPTGRFRTVKTPGKDPSPEFIKGDPSAFGGSAATTKTLGLGEALKNPLLIGKAIRENPFTAAGLLPVAGIGTELITRGAIGAAKMTPDALRAYANAVIPFADPFTKKEEVPTREDGTGLKRGDKNKNVGTVTGTTAPGQAGGTTAKSDAEKQQINEARIKETKDKYYKLMGIDKMNKDAVYDSLIDASNIVREEGADLKGSIRSGTLQSKIINAISKQLDKSADLKKQIDAAVLKGEIEKDIKRSDPDTAINREYKESQIALAKKKLEGPSVADVMSQATIDGKTTVTSNTLAQVLSGFGRDVDYTFPDDKYQKWEKNNKEKDEIDYLQENFSTLEDGLYVVNKKAFEIKGGTVFPVQLDKIKDLG